MSKRRPATRKATSAESHEYPRSQLVRPQWTNLNGQWDFAIDAAGALTGPEQVEFDQSIQVPFAPETPLSGVEDQSYFNAVWYRRDIETPPLKEGQRLILHFGAVDFSARVWINGQLAIEHHGGYTPFSADITDLLEPGKMQTIIVRAEDDPHDLSKPRGKQDWKPEPHSIWYPRTTGIWQTVWMEIVNQTHIGSIRWSANVRRWEIDLQARIHGPAREKMRLRVRLKHRDRMLAQDEYSVSQGSVTRTITLNDSGIDDARNELLWWPTSPNLIDAELELIDESGTVIDTVASYTAMRSVTTQGDRFILNGRPMYLRMVLDQGYWLDGGLTAPNDDALRRDVELLKEMGFNGARKHQKIEDPRFLYWADKLGLMVWEEMPSAYVYDDRSTRRLMREWISAIERDASHPCIIAWVPLNESWGVPDLPQSRQQRDFVRAIYYTTKSLDPTRPVIGNDGWENIATDIIGIHDYDGDLPRIASRYERSAENLATLFTHGRPGNKQLLLDDLKWEGPPVMLTEFGGIAFSSEEKTWGYRRAGTSQQLQMQYSELLKTVHSLPLFAGFCYTQFTDTYQEANGLLYMDRKPKFPIKEMSKANDR